MSYIIGLLHGRALRWAEAYVETSTLEETSFDKFIDHFKLTFSPTSSDEGSVKKFWSLKQCNRSVADFAIEFGFISATSGWHSRP